MGETSCAYFTGGEMHFSSDERRWINLIHRLKESHPDQVRILAEPNENDGCIYCAIPSAWLKIKPPTTRTMSDEQRNQARERMLKARENLAQVQGDVEINR